MNGELALAVTDPDPLPAGGHVGLHTVWGYAASFDDVVVRACR